MHNEKNKEEVYNDVINWLNEHLKWIKILFHNDRGYRNFMNEIKSISIDVDFVRFLATSPIVEIYEENE
jgi:hypothetical protein